ncbi:hypothetical protein PILCRDRAFT_9571 [Piloderma croceum F 1598]|uniref:F-box domain-containing protein n=1 Tax=Piloderma croceum (strain F 1598) TaxID=765440 RepID=A0A0C3BSQ7_PILCF|nr:hypothetical protein PILCRDRAFT_9571 [Piloderma croceum F 1598]
MHLCLQIAEILTKIFASYDDDKESITTLYSLTLACKIFHEPALDALWRFQRSFVTLLRMFPKDVWVETVDSEIAITLFKTTESLPGISMAVPDEAPLPPRLSSWKKPATLTFKRPLTPSDWARFQLYAKRMEHLSFDWSSNNMAIFGVRELSPSVFRAIESSLDLGHFEPPLLRNLSELTFNQDFGGVSLRDVCVFLGPPLKTLRLTIPSSLDGLEIFAAALKARCLAIEHLYISSHDRSGRVNRIVSDLFCSLSSLRTLSCEGITCDLRTLRYLSSLPFLRSLTVHLLKRLAGEGFLDSSSNILPFLAMRHLRISVASITDAGEFLQVVSSSSGLESLSITFYRILPTPEQLHAVFTVMQQSSFCDTLTTFALLDHVEFDEDSPPVHSLDAHTLSPLLQCRNLERVNIDISYEHAAIDNPLLKEIASAWPCLRNISLDPRYDARLWHSKANLQGLSYLARHCHSLQSVSLQFDVSLPATMIYPDKGIRCESLTTLDVSRSHVSDPLAVVTFLADVFPNLKLCHSYFIRTRAPGPRTIWEEFDNLSDDEKSPEYIEMAARWKDVVQKLEARKQELSQSLMSSNVRISSTIKTTTHEISNMISKSVITITCAVVPSRHHSMYRDRGQEDRRGDVGQGLVAAAGVSVEVVLPCRCT